jgi:hypothetical protein
VRVEVTALAKKVFGRNVTHRDATRWLRIVVTERVLNLVSLLDVRVLLRLRTLIFVFVLRQAQIYLAFYRRSSFHVL